MVGQRMPVQVIDKKTKPGMQLHPMQLVNQFFISEMMTE